MDTAQGRPILEPPFEGFQCIPVNVLTKNDSDEFQLIHNLSHPFGQDSVNSLISLEEASICYLRFDEFVDRVRRVEWGAELGNK